MTKLIKSVDFYALFFLYLISNLLLLSNHSGVYWDGWVIVNQDKSTLISLFTQIQHGIKGNFALYLLDIGNGIYSFRLFLIFSVFAIGILVYLILQNIKELDRKAIFFIVLFFMILPLNSGAVSISIIPFIFPVLIFYLAFYFLTIYLKNRIFFLRIIALTLFFLSFSTNSILVFYFLIFLYIYYFEFKLDTKFFVNKIGSLVLKYIDFIMLPFLYFIYKVIYLKPTGLYVGYNSLSLSNIPKAIKIIFKNLDNSFIEVIIKSLYSTLSIWPLVFLIIFLISKKINFIFSDVNYKLFFYIGLLLSIMAIFPYAVVGKNAELESWNSRFQLLLPLGLSLIFYFGIIILKKISNLNNKTTSVLLLFLVFMFISKNVSDQYKALKDSFYSISIIENMKKNLIIKNNTTFIVNNEIKSSLLYNREPIYYELNGMMKKAFNDKKRLAMNYSHYTKDFSNIIKLKNHKQYNFSQWQPSSNIYIINIMHNYKREYRTIDFIKMVYYNVFEYNKFINLSKELVVLNVELFDKEKYD